jgi:hypothetical protein
MSPAKALSFLGLVPLLSLTCGGFDGSSRSSAEAADRDLPAVDGIVTIEQAAMPARYAAPLPTTVAGLQSWLEGNPAIAPVSHVVQSILHGNPTWLARLSAAANAVSDTERLAWARKWHGMFKYETVDAAFCAQARTIMLAPPAAVRTAISGPFARSCAKAGDAPIVLRADTPYWAVLEFYDPWNVTDSGEKRRPFDPRLVAVAREVILDDSVPEARSAAFTLAAQRDPRAEAALLAIHSEVKDLARADQVAMALFNSRSADGKKRAVAACKRSPRDPMCNADRSLQSGRSSSNDERIPAAAVNARVAQLSALGFKKVGALNVAELNTDSADAILVAAGQAHWFDVETGLYPNQHDSLMRSLAGLVAPELDDAVFEERAPVVDDESEPYQLLAYADGTQYRTKARNLGDWYDVDAVLRLMNAIMEDRRADARYTNLATKDQTLIVVAAPPAAIEKAVKGGLLKLGNPSEAERVGKEFEERVLKSMPKGSE